MAIAVNTLRAELESIIHNASLAGGASRLRNFWQQQKEGKEEELRIGEAKLGVLQAKADAVRQAKEHFE